MLIRSLSPELQYGRVLVPEEDAEHVVFPTRMEGVSDITLLLSLVMKFQLPFILGIVD